MPLSCFLAKPKEVTMVIGTDASPSSLPGSLWPVKEGSARVSLQKAVPLMKVTIVTGVPLCS